MFQTLVSKLELFLEENVQLFPRGHNSIAALSERLPSSWTYALSLQSSIPGSIIQIWHPASGHVNDLLNVLSSHTQNIALVLPATAPPSLLYIFQRNGPEGIELSGWLGGLPATEQDIASCEVRLSMPLPQSYKAFSKVHNGFLLDGWISLGPRPVGRLYFVSTSVQDEYPHNGLDRLLAFSGDGAGNEQCYDLSRAIGDGDYITVDWDHEAREISKSQTFWKYLYNFVAKEISP